MSDLTTPELAKLLAEPFDPKTVKFKPAVVQGNRALALAYVDARVIQDRLDEVLGTANWQDEYESLPDGSVTCRLRIRFGGEWVTKMDVGSPSEQPDEHDRVKAAFSDALKRAAIKFGVGRYLYRLPSTWCDYDPQKRQFRQLPSLPGPARRPAAAPEKATRAEPPADERPTREACEEIDRLAKALHPHDATWLAKALDEKFGVELPAMLTKDEAERVLSGLKDRAAAAKKEGTTEKKAKSRTTKTALAANGQPAARKQQPPTETESAADADQPLGESDDERF
jgi:hypothetical protein